MAKILYHAVPGDWRKEQKYAFLDKSGSVAGVKWKTLKPDKRGNWLTEPTDEEFANFISVANKAGKDRTGDAVLFSECLPGVATKRDSVVFDFSEQSLKKRIQAFIKTYNGEVRRYEEAGRPKNVDDFVDYSDIKWSSTLKSHLARCERASFSTAHIQKALYRPFTRQVLYYDALLVDRPSSYWSVFPTENSTKENRVVCVNMTPERPFVALATNMLPESVCTAGFGAFSYCIPLFTYSEDGKHKQENITPKARTLFQIFYDDGSITAADIFHYVYAVLHHPAYRTRFAENLKRDLPRIPFVGVGRVSPLRAGSSKSSNGAHGVTRPTFYPLAAVETMQGDNQPEHKPEASAKLFHEFAEAGKKLAELHVNYESAKEFKLQRIENKEVKLDWRVEAMKLVGRVTPCAPSSPLPPATGGQRTARPTLSIIYNDFLTLSGIPPEVFDYKLGNRSALEWVIDQYRVTRDEKGNIASDPNRMDDEEYIVRLIGQVVSVSLETQKLVSSLPPVRFE